MKQLLLGIILISSLYSIECECPLNTGQEFSEKWTLSEQTTLNEGRKNKITRGFFKDSSKQDMKANSALILSQYPKTEESTTFIKTIEKNNRLKRVLSCEQNISVLPDGFEWHNYKGKRYQTNKYRILTQREYKTVGCVYHKGEDTNVKAPLGWEDNAELFYQNDCAEEKIGSEKKCKDNKGIVIENFEDGCKVRNCYNCQKEDEPYEDLTDYQIVLFEWKMNEEQPKECSGKIELKRKDCFETYRCVKEKEE